MAISPHETASSAMRACILRAWDTRTDTAGIADMFDLTEAEVDRILIEEREARRILRAPIEGLPVGA